jgi:hypothetical protein
MPVPRVAKAQPWAGIGERFQRYSLPVRVCNEMPVPRVAKAQPSADISERFQRYSLPVRVCNEMPVPRVAKAQPLAGIGERFQRYSLPVRVCLKPWVQKTPEEIVRNPEGVARYLGYQTPTQLLQSWTCKE